MARIAWVLAVLTGLASTAAAQSRPPDDRPGWTGVTEPEAVIAARRALMTELERLMKPIDSLTAGEPADVETLKSAALAIHAMLLATPHLFPPTTDRFDPAASEPSTLALPAIWQQWRTFAELDIASTAAAADLAAADRVEAVRAAAVKLRGSCDACHAIFTRPYVPSTASDADRDFDFDSVLPQ